MLTCPPSRVYLTASDLADFEKRWSSRQSARRDAENVRLGDGAARKTRLAFVPAAANIGRHRAESCSSQATICTVEDDDPTIYSNAASPAQRLDLPTLVAKSTSELADSRREHTSPQKQDGVRTEPTRSSKRLPLELDFPIYEDPPAVQAFIEARHFRQQRARGLGYARPGAPDLQHNRVFRPDSSANAPDVPTINHPSLYLDPGAPVFVPRTRFGSTTSISDSPNGGIPLEDYSAPVQGNQTTANLRMRSSFERNTQQAPRSSEHQSVISESLLAADASRRRPHGDGMRQLRPLIPEMDLPVSLVPADAPQVRRRRRTNDQNAALQRPLPGLDRYPAVRPPAVAFASRRNSGSQRQVIFPRRRSSRQHLIEFERSRRSQAQHDRPTHLTVPHNHERRPVSPTVSTSSRSTPNLLQPPSAAHSHTRSSSLSFNRSNVRAFEDVPPSRSRKAATTVSESSSLLEEILLQRDSPLHRIVQKYGQHPARPRSVGHSFERPPGPHARPSLLTGNPFGEEVDAFEAALDESQSEFPGVRPLLKQVGGEVVAADAGTASSSPAHPAISYPAQTPHKRHPTVEDPVALALALPSPELRSSPTVKTSPQLPTTPILRSGPASPFPSSAFPGPSSTAKSRHSDAGPTPSSQSLGAAVTPRIPIYNDHQPSAHQPQTPADITRSSRRNRGRSNTTSTHQSALSNFHPSPTLAPPERHPHRHTFPSAAPHVTVGTASVRAAPVVEPASARRDSLMIRTELRSSGSSENDIEDNLDGLEEDRRVWMQRHEDSSLDVTPPKEGRFERYLS